MLSKRLQTILDRKNPVDCSVNTLGTIFHRRKLCAVLPKRRKTTLDRKKILFNVVLILLGKLCTEKNPVQCCPRGSRKHWTGNNPVDYYLNALGTTLRRQKLCAMLPKILQTIFHRKKSCLMLS